MRCIVSSCGADSNCPTASDITFHLLPTKPFLREAWLKSLDREGWQPAAGSSVCSKHFLKKDLYVTCRGRCRVRSGAVPYANVQDQHENVSVKPCDLMVCRICFTTGCKLYSMKSCRNLYQGYEILTGLSIEDEADLPPFLCVECAQRLLNCARFRSRSLRAHLVLLEAIKKYDCITIKSINSIIGIQNPFTSKLAVTHNQTDHYDLRVEHVDEDNVNTEGEAEIRDSHNLNGDSIKPEEYINQGSHHDEGTDDDVMEHLPNWQEHTALSDVKVDKEITLRHEMLNDIKISSDMVCFMQLLSETVNDSGCSENNDVVNSDSHDVEKINGRVGDLPRLIDNIVVNDKSEKVVDDVSLAVLSKDTFIDEDGTKNKKTGEWGKAKVPEETQDSSRRSLDEFQKRDVDENIIYNYRLYCEICPYQTKFEAQLLSHLNAHAAKKSYNCDQCRYKTVYRQRLKEHTRSHAGEKPYVCDICKNLFSTKETLKRHLSRHSGEKPYECDVCKKRFKTKYDALSHSERHFRHSLHSCKICLKLFQRNEELQEHSKFHANEMFTCDICKKSFNTKPKLRSHLLSSHRTGTQYTCNVCSKTYASMYSLKLHRTTHAGEKPFTCDFCAKTFHLKSNLRMHMQLHTRANAKPYTCEICNKRLCDKKTLSKHLRIHSDEYRYPCKVCKKEFTEIRYLEKHLIIHKNERPFVCKVCNKGFNDKSTLAKHLRIHTGEKPHACDVCEKRFTDQSSLRKHTLVHSRERQFGCNFCEKAFKLRSNLIKHLKLHSGIKPFVCEVCKKGFANKRGLELHSRTHSGEKPYQCNVCHRFSRYLTTHQTHMKIHTGDKRFKCDVCNKAFIQKVALKKHLSVHCGKANVVH